MAASTTQATINQTFEPKKIDRFIVYFYNLEKNYNNVLADNIINISKPSFSLRDFSVNQKSGKPTAHHAKPVFNDINITFRDDNESLVLDAVYHQFYRQLGRLNTSTRENDFDQSKFDFSIKCFNSLNEIVETYNIKKAFFKSISPTAELNYTTSTGDIDSRFTVGVSFDDMEYVFTR